MFALLCTAFLVIFTSIMRALGQLVCGRLVGFKPLHFVAGPLELSLRPHWRIRLNRQPLWYFGRAVSIPPTGDHLVWASFVRRLGGTIGLIVTAFTLTGILLLDGGLRVASSAPALPWAVRIALLVAITVQFLAAFFFGYVFDSDALRVVFGGGPRALAWAATDALTHLAEGGIRPRDWDRALLERATAHVHPFNDQAIAHRLAYFNALDHGDVERAEHELYLGIRSLESVHKGSFHAMLRPLLQAEAAFFEACYHAKPDMAEDWLLKSNSGFVPKRIWLRAQAALLHATGESALAQKAAREGLAMSMRFEPPGIAILEDVWLIKMTAAVTEPAPRKGGPARLKPIKPVMGRIL
jgi:hypothetical protein